MQEQTTRLGLPYILPSQAQKHVPHNEALETLDALVQLVLATIGNFPPATPEDGACCGISVSPSGLWSARAGMIARWSGGAWQFIQPRQGWLAWCADENRLYVHDGSAWTRFVHIGPLQTLGVNTTPDETNRLALASDACLLTHDGADHRLKINKADQGDTASVVFQSDWMGQAELGLAGNNDFSIKVADGSGGWLTALAIGNTGHVATPLRPATHAWANVAPTAMAVGSLSGFTDMEFATGGFALGTPLPSGIGSTLVVPTSAYYLICLGAMPGNTSPITVDVIANGTKMVVGTGNHSGGPSSRRICASGIVPLAQGDWLALHHQGNAVIDFGFNKTDLSIIALT